MQFRALGRVVLRWGLAAVLVAALLIAYGLLLRVQDLAVPDAWVSGQSFIHAPSVPLPHGLFYLPDASGR